MMTKLLDKIIESLILLGLSYLVFQITIIHDNKNESVEVKSKTNYSSQIHNNTPDVKNKKDTKTDKTEVTKDEIQGEIKSVSLDL